MTSTCKQKWKFDWSNICSPDSLSSLYNKSNSWVKFQQFQPRAALLKAPINKCQFGVSQQTEAACVMSWKFFNNPLILTSMT